MPSSWARMRCHSAASCCVRVAVISVTVNLAGGQAFAETAKLELASLMLTSMLKDQFYRTADNTVTRLRELIAAMPDKQFAAKAAIYARQEAGMRSVTHLAAAEVAKSVKGEPWTKAFYEKVVRRPDDVLEVLAAVYAVKTNQDGKVVTLSE